MIHAFFRNLPPEAKETIEANIQEFNRERAEMDREVGQRDSNISTNPIGPKVTLIVRWVNGTSHPMTSSCWPRKCA